MEKELSDKLEDLNLSADEKALLKQKLKEIKKLLSKLKNKIRLPELEELLTD